MIMPEDGAFFCLRGLKNKPPPVARLWIVFSFSFLHCKSVQNLRGRQKISSFLPCVTRRVFLYPTVTVLCPLWQGRPGLSFSGPDSPGEFASSANCATFARLFCEFYRVMHFLFSFELPPTKPPPKPPLKPPSAAARRLRPHNSTQERQSRVEGERGKEAQPSKKPG